ncbi:hypothetical protein [Microbulbifer sp. ARAS458-1]|uniref:hypothetical protein n=1 Tax=Microbulbifer sp. ARAS458-1 TaxID=3140242 RepID=UPI00387821F5
MSLHRNDDRSNSVSMEEISAFADGALPTQRARQVARYLRLNPEAAKTVFDTWRFEGELLGELNAISSDKYRGDTTNASVRPLPWLSGVAAGAVLVLGVWALSLELRTEQSYGTLTAGARAAQVRPLSDQPGGAALVQVSAAPAMAVPDLEITAQQGASQVSSEKGPGTDLNGGGVAKAPSTQQLLPESPALAGDNFRLNFHGVDGTLLTLESYSLQTPPQATFHEGVPDTKGSEGILDGGGINEEVNQGRVHWVTSETLYVLTGNLDAAELMALAIRLHKQQDLQRALVAPRATEAIGDRGASGILNPASDEAAPGFSKM